MNAHKDLNLDSEQASSILDVNSQNPPSQKGEENEQISEGDETGALGEDGSPVRLNIAPAKTDIHAQAKLEAIIDEKNPYRFSQNAGYGDLNKVFAFEVENNISKVLQSILKPIVSQHEKAVLNIVDLQTGFADVLKNLDMVNRKLDSDTKMRDFVSDAGENTRVLSQVVAQEKDFVHKKLLELKQMQGLHDDRMAKYKDEKGMFERKHDQLRNDIREFETLAQDINRMNAERFLELKKEMADGFGKVWEELEAIKFENKKANTFMQMHKQQFSKLSTAIGVLHFNIDEIDEQMKDFHTLNQTLADTEQYLGYVLPLKIEETVFKSLMSVQSDNDKRLILMENTQEAYSELKDKLASSIAKLEAETDKYLDEGKLRKVAYATFDKKAPFIPDLKVDIKELIKTIRQEEKEEFGSDPEMSDVEQSKSKKSVASKMSSNVMLKSRDSNKKVEVDKSITDIPLDQKSNGSDTEKESQEQFKSFSSVKDVSPMPKKSMTIRKLSKVPTTVLPSRSGGGQSVVRGRVALHDVKLYPQDVYDFANRVGRNLLQNEKFLDKLADALDGIDIEQSEGVEYDSETEQNVTPLMKEPLTPSKVNYMNFGLKAPSDYQGKGMGSIKEEGSVSREDSEKAGKNVTPSPNSRRRGRDVTPPSQITQAQQNITILSEKSKTPASQKRAVTKKSTRETHKQIDQERKQSSSNIESEINASRRSDTKASLAKSKVKSSTSKQRSVLSGPLVKSELEGSADKSLSKNGTEQSDDEHHKSQDNSKLSGADASVNDPPKKTPRGRRGRGMNSPRDQSLLSSPNGDQEDSAYAGSRRRRGGGQDMSISSPGYPINGDISKEIADLKRAFKDLKASQANLEKRLNARGDGGIGTTAGYIESNQSENEKQNSSVASMTKLNTFKDSSPALPSGEGDSPSQIGEYVTFALFQQQGKTLQNVRENMRVLRAKVADLEKDSQSRKNLMSKLNANDGEGMLQLRESIDQKLDQVDLLMGEMKKELKRLQREDFKKNEQFDTVFYRLQELQNGLDSNADRITVSDNAMAIIFKLLRIQYALCHQDELDKQDIFLMGAKESTGREAEKVLTSVRGSLNNVSQLNQDSVDLAQNSVASSAHPGVAAKSKKKQFGAQTQSHFGIDVPVISSSGGHSLMTFDKNCMQCGGAGNAATQIPSLIKAFKMACLSYKPSPVQFESKTFERNQLIEAEGYLLYLALKQMSHLDLNTAEKNLLGANAESVAAAASMSSQRMSGQFANHDLLNVRGQMEGGKRNNSKDTGTNNPNLDESYGDYLGADQSVDSIYEQSFHASLHGVQANKVISTTKSKEYTRLANQVPSIYEIKGGQKTLAKNDKQAGPISGQKIQGSMTGPVIRQNIKVQDKLKRNVVQNRKQSKNRELHSNHQSSGPSQVFNFNTINVVGSSARPDQIISPTSPAQYFAEYMNQQSPKQRDLNFSTARETHLRDDARVNTFSGKGSDNMSQNAAHSVVDGGEAINPLFANTMNLISPRALGTAAGPQRNNRGGQVHGVNIKQRNTARQSLVVMGQHNLPSLNSGSIQLQTMHPMIAPNTARSGVGFSKNQADFTSHPSSGAQNLQSDFIKSQIFSQGRQPTAPTSVADSRNVVKTNAQGQVPETIKESTLTSPDLLGPQSARLPNLKQGK